MMAVWYSPADIRFTRNQVFFLIQNLPLLRDGFYPPDPITNGYIGADRKQNLRAPFTVPCELASEIDKRLESTELYGKLLLLEAKASFQIWQLSKDAFLALNYCSGWRRRRMSFSEWKKQSLYRQRRVNGYISSNPSSWSIQTTST